jgi:serralysin
MLRTSTLSLLLALSSFACLEPSAPRDEQAALSPSWESFRANPPVSWEAFRASTYRESFAPHRYIVDGDLPFDSEPALRAHYDAWLEQEYERAFPSSSALTVRNVLGADILWAAPQRTSLTYCISNAFGGNKAAVVTNLANAAASWRDRAAVQFVYVPAQDATCTNTNPNVVFSVEPIVESYFASAFFPDATRATRRLLITNEAFTTTAGGRDLEGILRHETGHILGFRHEHIHITCTGEATTESRQVTSYDVNSVMHYPQCRPSGTGGYRQTALDELGATTLYGAPRTTECLFNWAQATYPSLFAPASTTAVSAPYVYRFYSGTNSYLAVNVTDQNVYYQAPGGTPVSQGTKASWLTTSGCN